jgi:hypothetical protein
VTLSLLGLVRLFLSHMDWMRLEKIVNDFDLFGIETHPIPPNPHGLRAKRTSPYRAYMRTPSTLSSIKPRQSRVSMTREPSPRNREEKERVRKPPRHPSPTLAFEVQGVLIVYYTAVAEISEADRVAWDFSSECFLCNYATRYRGQALPLP